MLLHWTGSSSQLLPPQETRHTQLENNKTHASSIRKCAEKGFLGRACLSLQASK